MIESANLKGVAAKGLAWSTAERFGAQGIQFIFGILVTRILSLSDYGLLGMILIFMAVGQTLIDSGFGSALIWKKTPTPADYSTVFYFNISISLLLYAIFFFLAPFIARFYGEPQLVNLIRMISFNFIILSFSLVQQTILQKRVDFKLLAYVNIAGSLLAGVIALYLAFKGFGVWALVWQILIKSFLTTVLLWIYNQWRPVFVFSWLSLKELFNYGSKLSGAGLIYTIFQYLYFNVIGKLFPVDVLGLYTRATQLQEFPVKTLGNIFQRVAFPVFASIQDDNNRLKNAIGKTMRTKAFFNFPIMFGLIAISDPLISVFLTDKWLPASDYFKLLCLVGVFYSFHIINGEVLKAKGKSNKILKLELVTKSIMVINIVITWRWGITAIILGQLVAAVANHLLSTWYVGKSTGYTLLHQMKDVSRYVGLSLIMFLIISIFSTFISNRLTELIGMCFIGTSFYLVAAWVLGFEEIKEFYNYANGLKIFKKLKNE